MNSTLKIEPVRYEQAPAMVFAGTDRGYTFQTATEIPKQWQEFPTRVMPLRTKGGPIAYGVIHDAEGEAFRCLVSVEVASAEGLPEGIVALEAPAQRYAVFSHPGHVSTLCQTIDAMFTSWLPESGQQTGGRVSFIERYGEGFDPVSLTGDIEVWLPVGQEG